MVNVNVSKSGWKTIKIHSKPGESFADSFDRMLSEYFMLKELVKELDSKKIEELVGEEIAQILLKHIRKLSESKEDDPNES